MKALSFLTDIRSRTCAPFPLRTTLLWTAALTLFLVGVKPAGAQMKWSSAGPDGHSPIGVMGDHTHDAGEWMFSYMFERQESSGLRSGRNSVSVDDAWETYPMVPLAMTMDMHMGHVMFAPSSRVTLMGMFMWMSHRMDVRMANSLMDGHGGHGMEDGEMMPHGPSHRMTHEISGFADTEVGALVRVLDADRRRLHLNLGLGIPTGDVTVSDPRVVPEHRRLGYPMQLGSGSWEARPGITGLLQSDRLSHGAQLIGVLRINENSEGYRKGNEVVGTAWTHLRGSDWISPGVRIEGRHWGGVSGSDPALDPGISPENVPSLQGGTRVNGFLALNFKVPTGSLAGHRVGLEIGGPILESLEGPQISRDWSLSLGWEYAL